MYKQKNKDKAPKVKNTKRASVIYIFFVYIFLASGGDSPLYPEILHNDPAAHQDHCGRCLIRTRDLCSRSLARYQ